MSDQAAGNGSSTTSGSTCSSSADREGHHPLQRKGSSSFFDQLLESGGEIEGLFQQQKTKAADMLQGTRKLGKKASLPGDPLNLLREQVALYNNKSGEEFKLKVVDESTFTCSGVLTFHYHSGYQLLADNVQVKNTDTVSSLIPILLRQFIPQYESTGGNHLETSHGYVTVSQGGTERELDNDEHPLAMAIDCSTKGLAPPSFTFKTSPGFSLSAHSTPQHISKLSSTASSQTSLGPCSSEGSESPRIIDPAVSHVLTDGDHDSIYSFGSSTSVTTPIGVSLKSPRTHGRPLHKIKSQVAPKGPQRTMLDPPIRFSESNLLSPGVASPSSLASHQLTPEMVRKASKHKSRMGNFVEGVARSFKSKRKPRPMSIYPEEELDLVDSQEASLDSPVIEDSSIPVCTVFHVYYSNAKHTQLYKSVLVSEQSTVNEVIKQSLERYGLKFMDPAEFHLCEVIGKWETISKPMDTDLEESFGHSLANSPKHTVLGPNTKYSSKGALEMEEFVQCYARVLQSDEKPYEIQFFHIVPDGYSRRFELKSKADLDNASGENGKENGANISPVTPVFGATSHDHARRRNRLKRGGQSFDFGEETREEDTEKNSTRKPSSVPDLSLIECSSPDSGVELHKDSRILTKSSIASDQSDPAAASASVSAVSSSLQCGLYPALNSGAFLLNLQPTHSEKEFLIYKLLSEQMMVTEGQTPAAAQQDEEQAELAAAVPKRQSRHGQQEVEHGKMGRIELWNPIGKGEVILCIIASRERVTSNNGTVRKSYVVSPGDEGSVHVNGQELSGPEELYHGDLVQLGQLHTFIFHDYSMHPTPNGKWHCRWKPVFCPGVQKESALVMEDSSKVSHRSAYSASHDSSSSLDSSHVPSPITSSQYPQIKGRLQVTEERLSPAIARSSEIVIIDTASHADIDQPSSPAKLVYIAPDVEEERRTVIRHAYPQMEAEEVDAPDLHVPIKKASKEARTRRGRSNSETRVTLRRSVPVSCSSNSLPYRKHNGGHRKFMAGFPANRKLMFSYDTSEEDVLLDLLITSLDLKSTHFKLTPSYLLAMCMEYSLKCCDSTAANRLVYKAVSYIQETVRELTDIVKQWKPQPFLINQPDQLLQDIHPFLYPLLFWFANCLELYHYLFTQREPLQLSTAVENGDTDASNALTILEELLFLLFRQVFYSISKVLYMMLPFVLDEVNDSASESEDAVLNAVDFLKGVLELMLDLHVHTEMVAQFFANVFFFLNGALFNMLIDRGEELGLFYPEKCSKICSHLDILKGWAGRVGFRELVVKYLDTFSSAVDLLSLLPTELTMMSWSQMLEEFPCLSIVQLQFLLSHYKLPVEFGQPPLHWTPNEEEEAAFASNEFNLHESFDHHPELRIPTCGFLLELNSQPLDGHLLQEFVNSFRTQLKKRKRSTSMVATVEERPSVAVPTLIQASLGDHDPIVTLTTSQHQPPRWRTNASRRNGSNRLSGIKYGTPLIDVAEIVRDSPEPMREFRHQNIVKREKVGPQTGRVRSMLEPQSQAAPEKFVVVMSDDTDNNILESEHHHHHPQQQALVEEEEMVEILGNQFPAGSRPITIQRGARGFGLVITEGKNLTSQEPAIFVQSATPTGPSSEGTEVRPGDMILAVDDQLLNGTDFAAAQKYIKEAEEELTLVIAPRTLGDKKIVSFC